MQRIAVIDKGINKLTVRYQLSDHLGSSCVELNENSDSNTNEIVHYYLRYTLKVETSIASRNYVNKLERLKK